MRAIAKIYLLFIWLGKIIQPFFLLALRLFFGWQFFQMGYNKLGNMDQTVQMFMANGIPNAAYAAQLVAWVEIIGGALLFLGLLTRVAAIPLIITMFTALGTVHLEASQAILTNPIEFLGQLPVSFLITSLVLLCFGPGLFSFDAIFKRAWLDEPREETQK